MRSHASSHRSRRTALCAILALLLATQVAGCARPQPTAEPLLVTLPAVRSTAAPSPTAPPTPSLVAPSPTAPLPVTPAPSPTATPSGLHLLWQAEGALRPVALSAGGDRVAVLGADGRFAWLAAASGQMPASTSLWAGADGHTQGEVHTGDGRLAVVAAQRQRVETSGRVRSWARLAVLDASAEEMWSLPELASGHRYSAALLPGTVIAGAWPRGAAAAPLAAYDVVSGERLWQVSAWPQPLGVSELLADAERIFAVIDTDDGRGVARFDTTTGGELWRWLPGDGSPERLALDGEVLLVLGADRLWALNASTGRERGSRAVAAAPGAGFAAARGLLVYAPAPGAAAGYRPGVTAISVETGEEVWHALDGLVADALALGGERLWVLAKDFDAGEVTLHAIDPLSGAGREASPAGQQPEPRYSLAMGPAQVFVLGESLQALGY